MITMAPTMYTILFMTVSFIRGNGSNRAMCDFDRTDLSFAVSQTLCASAEIDVGAL